MDTLLFIHNSWPREFRVLNARFKKLLRTAYSTDGTMQMRPQVNRVFMHTVGQIAFSMSPNMFNRINFRGIARKSMDMKTLGLFQENFDVCPFVDRPTVPDQNNMPAQMMQQMPQKSNDFRSGDVMGMKTDIKTQVLTTRRYGETSDDRDPITPVAMTKDRCAARRCPSFTNVRYEQKPAFVQKGKMGPKSLGFFLYEAMSCFSSVQWLFRLFEERVVPAFGSSSQNRCVTVSTPPRAYIGLRSRPESDAQYVLTSISRWRIRLHQLLAVAFSLASLSDDRSRGMAVPIWPGSEFLFGPSFDNSDAIVPPNSERLSPFEPLCDMVCLKAAWLWLADAAFLTVWDFHLVSYPII